MAEALLEADEDRTSLGPEVSSSSSGAASHQIVIVDGGSPPSAKKQKKLKTPCPGCLRIYQFDLEFLLAGTYVKWRRDAGDGLWCDGCYCCHRTTLEKVVTLTNFGTWLQNEANSQQWFKYLIAYYMLKQECSNY